MLYRLQHQEQVQGKNKFGARPSKDVVQKEKKLNSMDTPKGSGMVYGIRNDMAQCKSDAANMYQLSYLTTLTLGYGWG